MDRILGRALWLKACRCGAHVSDCFYCAYHWIQKWRGLRDEDGLNKCYSVLLWYSHHLPHRKGHAGPPPRGRQTAPLPSAPLCLEGWQQRGMEIYSGRAADPASLPRSARLRDSAPTRRDEGTEPGCGPGEDAAGRGKHQLAGKRTTNTYACERSQAEMSKHENQNVVTPIYMRGEETHKKMAHCNQYFCRLYRTVYNKKRSIYKNQNPLLLVELTFFFPSEQKHSFCGGEWDVFVSFSLLFFFFSLPPPNHI